VAQVCPPIFDVILISGVTASIIFLALEASGFASKKSVYDGSWTEYAARHANNADMIAKQ